MENPSESHPPMPFADPVIHEVQQPEVQQPKPPTRPKVAIVTPTIGSKYLSDCLTSVKNQTYKNIIHYIFIDGVEYLDKVEQILIQVGGLTNLKRIILEDNVGKGWYGHRSYAASAFLVNADIICYLDEDNMYDKNHIEELVKKIEEGYDWAYSLRTIHSSDGSFICEDNCESLCEYPIHTIEPEHYHIDTSCLAIKRSVAVQVSHTWYNQWGADRKFGYVLRQHFPNFTGSTNYSLMYRLDSAAEENPSFHSHDGNTSSPIGKEFFLAGNNLMYQKYGANFPWRKPKQK
jgi:glycosyltransferase involved in cell wall biosynthesis